MDNTAPHRPWVTCPGCSEPFDPEAEAEIKHEDGSLQCPFCSTRFVPAAGGPGAEEPAAGEPDAGEFTIQDDTPAPVEEEQAPDEKELNRNKVRQLSALRRAAYKTRSYFVIAAAFLLIAAVQLVMLTVRRVSTEGWENRAIGYTFFAIAALMGAGYFAQRIIGLTRELRKPVTTDPETPPDFSTLSDGSQYWQRLQDM